MVGGGPGVEGPEGVVRGIESKTVLVHLGLAFDSYTVSRGAFYNVQLLSAPGHGRVRYARPGAGRYLQSPKFPPKNVSWGPTNAVAHLHVANSELGTFGIF